MSGELHWSIEDLANAMKIEPMEVQKYFTDGRKVSFVLERRIAKEFFKGRIAHSESDPFDIVDADGGRWEVRSITKTVYFSPSKDVGSGRQFSETNFFEKLGRINGYVLCDVSSFPDIPFWVIPSNTVRTWYNNHDLSERASTSRTKILKLIDDFMQTAPK